MALLKPLTASDRKWLRRTRRLILALLCITLLTLTIARGDTSPVTYATTGLAYRGPTQQSVCRTSDGTIHIVTNGNYYHSHDDGATWASTALWTGPEQTSIACDVDDELIAVFLIPGTGVLQSRHATVTKTGTWSWSWAAAITIDAGTSYNIDAAVDMNGYYHVIYLTTGGGGTTKWARSINSGASWTVSTVACLTGANYVSSILADSDSNLYFFSAAITLTLKAVKVTYTASPESWSISGCTAITGTVSSAAGALSARVLDNDKFLVAYADGGSANLKIQLSVNPHDITGWEPASTLESAGVDGDDKSIAVVSNSHYRVYYTNASTSMVVYKESTDNGNNWGSQVNITSVTLGGDGAAKIDVARHISLAKIDYIWEDDNNLGKAAIYAPVGATTTTMPGATTTTMSSGFDLPNVPDAIGNALGINTDAGGLLLSFILFFMILVPLGMLTKNFWVILIAGLTLAGFLTAITWLPVWIMVMLCLITALMLGSRLTGLVSRGGTGGSEVSDEGD